jgi:uncharacterized protein
MRNALVFFLSALLVLAGGSAWLALYPNVPDDLGGVESLDARARHVRIPVGDDHLDGWYLAGEKPVTVVLLAGYARDHRRMWRYAHFLHDEGLGVLNVDFRSARRFDRKPTTLGYWEVRDAGAAIDWVRAAPECAGHRIVLFGESLGASAAIAAAADRPEVAAVVADCPFASADEAIADGFECVLRMPPFPLTTIARGFGRIITGHDPGALDVTRSLHSLGGRPVLVIQTSKGDRFTTRQVERVTGALGLSSDSWTMDDVRHNEAWLRHRMTYEDRVSTFLRERLPLGAPVPAGVAVPVAVAAGAVRSVRASAEPVRVAVEGVPAKPLRARTP